MPPPRDFIVPAGLVKWPPPHKWKCVESSGITVCKVLTTFRATLPAKHLPLPPPKGRVSKYFGPQVFHQPVSI